MMVIHLSDRAAVGRDADQQRGAPDVPERAAPWRRRSTRRKRPDSPELEAARELIRERCRQLCDRISDGCSVRETLERGDEIMSIARRAGIYVPMRVIQGGRA